MKYIFLAAWLTSTAALSARTPDLTGTWKETRRSTITGSAVSFTDTMRIEFLVGNEYTRRKPMGFVYRGTYKLTDKLLDMGAIAYRIASATDNRLELTDENGRYVFERYTEQPSAQNPSARSNAQGAAARAVPQSLAPYAGNWEVFKRTSSGVLQQIDYSRLIRSITLANGAQKDSLGGVFAANDVQGHPSWHIISYRNGLLACTGRDGREIRILSAAEKELILEEAGITYFMKRF